MSRLWSIIPAGGAGTRLWPLSRERRPKFLLDLTGSGRSLLQQTVDRLAPLVEGRVLVVTGADHADQVRADLPELGEQAVLVEPSRKDSMAAIGLAAAVVEAQDPDAVVGSFAADHVIADPDRFRACVQEAVVLAEQGHLVTIGITPTGPATGFGYIRVGAPLDVPGAPRGRAVAEFVEKPDLETARGYLSTGEFLWNAGMFVARAGTLLDLLADRDPSFAQRLRDIAADPTSLAEVWPSLPRIAIDHAVAEPAAAAGRVAVVPGDFAWDDVGDFASLTGVLPTDSSGLAILGDAARVHGEGSSGLVVAGTERDVVVLGMTDVVVVDTGEVLLVTTRERAQDVKGVIERLKDAGRTDLA